MSTKKIIWMLFLFFLLPLSKICLSEEQRSLWPKPSIKLTGGGRYTAIGDMNTHLDSMNYIQSLDWFGVSGKIEKLNNWSGDWEVELKIDLSPQIAFGLAASIFRRRIQSSIEAYKVDPYRIDRQFIFKPEIEVIMPLGFNLYYSIHSRSKLNISISAGVSWYLAKMKEALIKNAIYPLRDAYFDNRFWEVKNNLSFGFQAGVGLEYNLMKNLALVAELQSRYIRIGNLRGTVKYETNYGSGLTIVEGGHLHFFGSRDTYFDLDIPLPIHIFPRESEYIERKAILDLSGFSLRMGIRIKLL